MHARQLIAAPRGCGPAADRRHLRQRSTPRSNQHKIRFLAIRTRGVGQASIAWYGSRSWHLAMANCGFPGNRSKADKIRRNAGSYRIQGQPPLRAWAVRDKSGGGCDRGILCILASR